MSRIILYYPSIAIRNPRWIRQMILYWDSIGTIVPHELADAAFASKDLEKLRRVDMFRLFHPEEEVSRADKLVEEFKALNTKANLPKIDPEEFDRRGDRYSVHAMKIPTELRDYLVEERISVYSRGNNWMEMRKETGLLYMSLLAKYLANDKSRVDRVVTPGTDYGAYADIILKARSTDEAVPGLSFTLNNVLPFPKDNIDIDIILDFKQRRKDELLEFRKKIYEFQGKIKNEVRDTSDLSDYLEQFSEEINLEVRKIEKEAKNAKMPTVLGRIETILAAGDSPLIKSLEKTLPAPLPLIAQSVAGAISLRKYELDVKNAQQDKLIENSFSYIYHAQKEGIIATP